MHMHRLSGVQDNGEVSFQIRLAPGDEFEFGFWLFYWGGDGFGFLGGGFYWGFGGFGLWWVRFEDGQVIEVGSGRLVAGEGELVFGAVVNGLVGLGDWAGLQIERHGCRKVEWKISNNNSITREYNVKRTFIAL